MGLLVDSFNSMTQTFPPPTANWPRPTRPCRRARSAEQRRRYMETILENVAAGVIAINERNGITTINRFAEELLADQPHRLSAQGLP